MSEWIKLHAAVFVHPKTRRMAKRLGVSPAAVVGHLASLDRIEDGEHVETAAAGAGGRIATKGPRRREERPGA